MILEWFGHDPWQWYIKIIVLHCYFWECPKTGQIIKYLSSHWEWTEGDHIFIECHGGLASPHAIGTAGLRW
jgi:hypothetical protein